MTITSLLKCQHQVQAGAGDSKMGALKQKIKFPCGYEFEIEAKGLFLEYHCKDEELPVCPIHKEKCHEGIK